MAANVLRELFRKMLLVVALLVSCFIAGVPVWGAGRTQAQADKYLYYIEFRAAVDGVYGHSYIVYGRLNALGQTATAVYADIHPIGGFTSMVLGHFFALAASTTPEKDTLGHKIASRFRLPLTAKGYRRLRSIIARLRADRHTWSILAYNCNDFVADVARGMGMRTPTTLLLPYAFIPMLRARNENMIHRVSMPAFGRFAEIQ